jgi:hypothetical protein
MNDVIAFSIVWFWLELSLSLSLVTMDNTVYQSLLLSMINHIIHQVRVSQLKSGSCYKVMLWCICSIWAIDPVVVGDDTLFIQLASQTSESHPDSTQIYEGTAYSGLIVLFAVSFSNET